MFNIGFGELAVICIVLIIAVGPERLPSMMKTLGKTIRTLRQASRDIRASTGIDELLREDFDLYAPIKPSPPKRPASVTPAAPAAAALAESNPAASEAGSGSAPGVPVSREEGPGVTGAAVATGAVATGAVATEATAVAAAADPAGEAHDPEQGRDIEALPADRPSVVVAPPPQAVGSPVSHVESSPALSEPVEVARPAEPAPSAAPRARAMDAPMRSPSVDDTLPRAALPQGPPAAAAAAAPAVPDAQTAHDGQDLEPSPSGPSGYGLADNEPDKQHRAEPPDADAGSNKQSGA